MKYSCQESLEYISAFSGTSNVKRTMLYYVDIVIWEYSIWISDDEKIAKLGSNSNEAQVMGKKKKKVQRKKTSEDNSKLFYECENEYIWGQVQWI